MSGELDHSGFFHPVILKRGGSARGGKILVTPALPFGGGRSLRNQIRLSPRNFYADSDRSNLRSTFEHADREGGKIYERPTPRLAGRNRVKKTRPRAALARRAHTRGRLIRENWKVRASLVESVAEPFS